MELHFRRRDGGTVRPNLVERVEIGTHLDTVALEEGLHPPDLVRAIDPSVETHHRMGGATKLTGQPVGDSWRTLHFEFHQHDTRAAELLLGSKEVAGVGPERGSIHRDDDRASRAIEARDPLAALPVVGDILTIVCICAGEDESPQSLALHHLAERGYSFYDLSHYI